MLNLFHMSNVNEGHHYFQLSGALDTNEYEKYLLSYIWDFIYTIISVLNTVFPFSLSCKLLCVIQNLPKIIKEQFKTAWNLPTNNILSLLYTLYKFYYYVFPGGSDGKEASCSAGYLASISGLGRCSWEGTSYQLQYSGLENPHGQRSLSAYGPWGRRVGHDWATKPSTEWLPWFICKTAHFETMRPRRPKAESRRWHKT